MKHLKIFSLAIFAGLLSGSCGQGKDLDQLSLISIALLINSDESLEVSFRSQLIDPSSPFGETIRMKVEGRYLSRDETDSSYWVAGFYDGRPEQWYFQQNVNGSLHTLLENTEEESEWDCSQLKEGETAVYSPISLYPRGGANLLAQVHAMLEELGPVTFESGKEVATLEWKEIPSAIKEDMIRHFNIDGWKGNLQIETVSLTMNTFLMVPEKVVVQFTSGAFVITDFWAVD